MYFVPSDVIAARIVGEALAYGAGDARVLRRAPYWLVAADIDWFVHSGVTTPELFARIVPFRREVNAMWAEVLLHAYCDAVFTWSATESLTIKGDEGPLRAFAELAGSSLQGMRVGRLVGFTELR